MGVAVKYIIDFPDAGIKVTNNLLSGGYLLDAEVTAEMIRGTAGCNFEIRLTDLPVKKEAALYAEVPTPKDPLALVSAAVLPAAAPVPVGHVTIKLGYSDLGPFDTVIQGVIDSVRAVVQADKLITIVKGTETATYVVQKAKYKNSFPAGTLITKVISDLVSTMTPPGTESKPGLSLDTVNITNTLTSAVTYSGENLMPLLQRLADTAEAQLFVGDGKIYMGKPIRRTEPKVTFKRDRNLALFEAYSVQVPAEANSNFLQIAPAKKVAGFTFTIAGNPALRPGNQVATDIDTYDTEEFRIHSIRHVLSMTAGYSCQGQANKESGAPPPKGADARVQRATPEALATGISTLVTATVAAQQPVIEIGQVKEYVSSGAATHRATLYYGQKYERTETQPSVAAAVQNDDQQIAAARPLLSPFAFHKCGLIVPVYKGMKAVMAHNRALEQDSIVTGYIWSDTPAITPPANQPGDWWLCLPADYTDSALPTDSTKSTNDLTANNGKRVIQVKGLKIIVGSDLLTPVGKRPEPGDDDEFLIQHKKASIKISADGSLEIMADAAAQHGKITISSSGDIQMTATGAVTLKIGASGVQIS